MTLTRAAKQAGPVTEPATWITEMLDADPTFRAKVNTAITQLEIGDKLAELRKARKMSQAQLGRRLGVSQSAIAQLETGTATNYELRTLARYTAALGASVEVTIRRHPRQGARARRTAVSRTE